MRLTEKGSTAMNNVYDVPKFWANLNALVHSSNLNIIESCITRAYCMQGALNFHLWLIDIVQHAVNVSSRKSSGHSWIQSLARDVETAVSNRETTAFDSLKYLPNLAIHRRYTYTPGPFRFDQSETISATLSSILRLWLHFPSDENSLLQVSLIKILASKSPSSIFFLDKIWEMYVTPFSTVFNVWKGHASKTNIEKSLANLGQQYDSHPFTTDGSSENLKLKDLSKLITDWMGINGLDPSTLTATVSRLHDSSLLIT
jgi:hypothetical protein